jgi:cation diffusion facilitator family transporter
VVWAALGGNLAIATCKFVAAYFTGSAATLAEAVHSLADTGNQGLLLLGMLLAARGASPLYAFGRATERYFWPFVVALMLFSVGGAFAIYEGVHKWLHPTPPSGSALWSLVVLALSTLFESGSFAVAMREFRALKGKRTFVQAMLHGRDPTIPLVLLEDAAALVGLLIALGAVGVSAWTGNPRWDSAGSVLIGLVLCATASLLAYETHGLLIGESATPEMRGRLLRLAEATPGVRRVTQLLTLHLGPDEVVAAMKVAFTPNMPVEQVEATTNEIERRVRAELPEMKKMFVEVDAHGDLQGLTDLSSLPPGPLRSDAPAGES